MYQYITGFLCGVWVGTHYDLEPYVTLAEKETFKFLATLKKRHKIEEENTETSEKIESNNAEVPFYKKYF